MGRGHVHAFRRRRYEPTPPRNPACIASGSDPKQLSVSIRVTAVVIKSGGAVIRRIEPLFARVRPTESVWTVSEMQLAVVLEKVEGGIAWPALLEDVAGDSDDDGDGDATGASPIELRRV